MLQKLEIQHRKDEKGNPAGGSVRGVGIELDFQNGPLGLMGAERRGQNGCFVEDLLAAAISRLEFYQSTKFKCDYNADAIMHLREAAKILEARTKERQARGVEGTHTV
jgi:hypothetical protein